MMPFQRKSDATSQTSGWSFDTYRRDMLLDANFGGIVGASAKHSCLSLSARRSDAASEEIVRRVFFFETY